MPRIRTEQQRFTKGEIDPLMLERGDIDQYYGGVAKAYNCISLRQGGISSRMGLKFLEEIPEGQHKFIDFEVSFTDKYVLIVCEGKIIIYKNGERLTEIEQTIYAGDVIKEITWASAFDTTLIFHPSIKPYRILRNSDSDWVFEPVEFVYIPKYDFVPVSTDYTVGITPTDNEGEATLNADGDVFQPSWVGQQIEGNGGICTIALYVTARQVKVNISVPFFDTDKFSSWTLNSGYVDAWSDERGWPICGCFHENRLVIGGSNSLPGKIWMSRTDRYFDFNIGKVYDDDGIDYQLPTYNRINNVISGRNLQVFTIGDEWVSVQSLNDPITPKTVNFKQQTQIGSVPNLKVYGIEGATYFLNSSSLHEFLYDDTQSAYASNIVSLLSGHLIKDPQDITVRKEYTNLGATYIVIVNEDGHITMVNILRSQDILSFTDLETKGIFTACGTDGRDIFVAVDRVIDGETKHYLEKFDTNAKCDSSTFGNIGVTEITGLEHLEGEEVQVVADGSILTARTVVDGKITIERAAEEFLEVGLNFTSEIKDLPVQTPGQGTTLGYKKNVSEVVLDLYNTNDIRVNGQIVSFRKFGPSSVSPLDREPPYFTGIKSFFGFRGWDNYGQVTIRKEVPGSFTIRSISKKVNY